jgi:hypothetical protein
LPPISSTCPSAGRAGAKGTAASAGGPGGSPSRRRSGARTSS